MVDMIRLRTVLRDDGTFVLADQDGRIVTNITTVERVWRVDEVARMRFEVYDTDEQGLPFPTPDGWDPVMRRLEGEVVVRPATEEENAEFEAECKRHYATMGPMQSRKVSDA